MKRIGTHSGSHHADDALGVAMLKLLHPAAEVVRSRDPEVWATCDALVDVGSEHDPARNRFDHHQKGFAARRANGVPYAGSGLVWQAYGAPCVKAVMPKLSDAEAAQVADEVDAQLIQWADSVDVGIDVPGPSGFNLAGMVGSLNGTWQEEADDGSRFAEAYQLAGMVLRGAIRDVASRRSAAAIVRASQTLENGRILLVDVARLPFEPVVSTEMPDVLFVVYPESSGQKHQVRVVPKVLGRFEARADLPAAWAGLQGGALAEVTGVPDAIFCHNGRFICGASSREGAIRLAQLAVAALQA